MQYRLAISDDAIQQLRDLPKDIRRNIGFRLEGLQSDLAGDVKKLSGREHKYRLRVGSHRVLFELVNDEIRIYAVKNRKEAYD